MIKEAIYHISDSTYAYPIGDNTLMLKLRTKKKDVSKIILYYGNRYDTNKEVKFYETCMDRKFSDDMFDYFEAGITTDFKTICYYFKIISGDETVLLVQDRFMNELPDLRNRYYMFPYICNGDLYNKAEWWEELVIYQIFVDRFNKEDIDEKWNRIPNQRDVFGGNLRGIINKLDYLSSLGINCLYLTPIFAAQSNHKYDTRDYFNIDKDFGDKDSFRELVDECHRRNIRVILDAVFNHTGIEFFAFKDYIKNGDKSEYKDWYYVKKNGDYETFGNVKQMPKLNTSNPEVIDYLLNIARYWIKEYDIDGWRLDVANEIDHKFWRKFKEAVKAEKEDAIIIGEVWDGGENYLEGDQFDTVMNYPFMYDAIDYFAKGSIDTEGFDYYINNLFARYKTYTRGILVNLIDSHDTSRFLYECGNNIEKLKIAVFFLMTCIGVPMMFYGDEAGISGGNDPDCRRTMNFNNINMELMDYYKKLIQIRTGSSSLKHGGFKTLYTGKGAYAYLRYTDNENVICLLNNSQSVEEVELVVNGVKAWDLFNGTDHNIVDEKLKLIIEPYGKLILNII